jgi:hypothetical protein
MADHLKSEAESLECGEEMVRLIDENCDLLERLFLL